MKKITLFLSLYFLDGLPLLASDLSVLCPHKAIPLRVELAMTPGEQHKGLMFRSHLDEDEGMLFLLSQPSLMAMWMKNTLISLDMIFADKAGKILAIYENAKPFSEAVIGPVEGTTQVLEILGGSVKKKGITKACTLKLHS